MYYLRVLTYILIIIGALNWGLVGFMNIDAVALLFGEMSVMSRIIYGLVGISAILSLISTYRHVFFKYDI
jgi:uncharacterized membrane protein YuzA (DUF378 family)